MPGPDSFLFSIGDRICTSVFPTSMCACVLHFYGHKCLHIHTEAQGVEDRVGKNLPVGHGFFIKQV